MQGVEDKERSVEIGKWQRGRCGKVSQVTCRLCEENVYLGGKGM